MLIQLVEKWDSTFLKEAFYVKLSQGMMKGFDLWNKNKYLYEKLISNLLPFLQESNDYRNPTYSFRKKDTDYVLDTIMENEHGNEETSKKKRNLKVLQRS